MPRPVPGDIEGVRNSARFGRGALFALCFVLPHLSFAAALADSANGQPALTAEHSSSDAHRVLAWVIETNDNQDMPFVIVDKVNAQVLAFDRQGSLMGAAPALLGLARGDDSPAGIGARALANITVNERTTPAGRFAAALGANLEGKEILWVDYDAALSLHPVIVGKASDRRAQRLATTSTLDNRISYGCINVPAAFFKEIVSPLFKSNAGVVYILPETRSVEDVLFGSPSAKRTAARP
jgi:hypothetical protein